MKRLAASLLLASVTLPAHAQDTVKTVWPSLLPPLKYDHEYNGELIVTRVNAEQMNTICPVETKRGWTPGCAVKIPFSRANACMVFIVEDALLKETGLTYEMVARHERSHCNGWPHNQTVRSRMFLWHKHRALQS
jgi:hypothetical protein